MYNLIFFVKNSSEERMNIMETLQKICLVFTIIGAIVWGLIGLFDWNILEWLFGDTFVPRLIQTLVGVTGIINIGLLFNHVDSK